MYPSHDRFCIIYHASKQILTRLKRKCAKAITAFVRAEVPTIVGNKSDSQMEKKKRKERNQPIKEGTRLRGVAQGLFDP